MAAQNATDLAPVEIGNPDLLRDLVIARALGCSDEHQIHAIEAASLLHDLVLPGSFALSINVHKNWLVSCQDLSHIQIARFVLMLTKRKPQAISLVLASGIS